MYKGTTEKTCIQCGGTFRGGANLTCNPCRTIDRECVTCGKTFRGRERQCYECQATDRPCKICGKIFHGVKRTCEECRGTERSCTKCGQQFRGTKNVCPSCHAVKRECTVCGRTFRSTAYICPQCTATDRECTVCGKPIHSYQSACRSCHAGPRICKTCSRQFRGDQVECPKCRYAERTCVTCGRAFRSHCYLECGNCSGRTYVTNSRRRARRLAAQINGPLPRLIYVQILASGPCVYCGAPAESIDHVRPLAAGGDETEDNLVPACGHCNKSKSAKLLIHWDPERVAHGAAQSSLVAAELERELSGIRADLRRREAGTSYDCGT
jgi:HNH endonuclease